MPIAAWLATRARRSLLAAAVVLSAALSAYVALPLLPARSLQGSLPLKLNKDLGEEVGWPRFAATITRAWASLPDRAHTAIFTSNYGEASAVDLLAHLHAYSGHNGYSLWGAPPDSDTKALVIGDEYLFTDCRRVARINDRVGLANDEQGTPVSLCRPSAPWTTLWPRLRHYG